MRVEIEIFGMVDRTLRDNSLLLSLRLLILFDGEREGRGAGMSLYVLEPQDLRNCNKEYDRRRKTVRLELR